jgi:rhomboid protease GluP
VVAMTLLYGMVGNIDNAGHVGGLLGGIALGYGFYPTLGRPEDRGLQSRTIILSVWAVLVLVAAAYFHYR